MDKKTIARNFSRYAHTYDIYADIQQKTGIELLSGIKKDRFKNIMELGCGTGNYTLLLRKRFKKAEIKALDISDKMIAVARDKLRNKGIKFIVRDAEDLNIDEELDLITSNACFQWFQDLEKALLRYKGQLKKDGIILFSVFGPLTFQELNFSLKSVLKGAATVANGFIPASDVKRALYKNFKDAEIEEIRYEESFDSIMGLLNKIKYTGERGAGLGDKFSFSRRALEEIERVYLNRFRRIKATYQVFFCRGRA